MHPGSEVAVGKGNGGSVFVGGLPVGDAVAVGTLEVGAISGGTHWEYTNV